MHAATIGYVRSVKELLQMGEQGKKARSQMASRWSGLALNMAQPISE